MILHTLVLLYSILALSLIVALFVLIGRLRRTRRSQAQAMKELEVFRQHVATYENHISWVRGEMAEYYNTTTSEARLAVNRASSIVFCAANFVRVAEKIIVRGTEKQLAELRQQLSELIGQAESKMVSRLDVDNLPNELVGWEIKCFTELKLAERSLSQSRHFRNIARHKVM